MSTPAVVDTPEEWAADALAEIRWLASTGSVFTSDDLRRAIRPAPTPNAVGSVFQVASRRGWITEHGTTRSTSPSRKGSLIRQWVGTTHTERTRP